MAAPVYIAARCLAPRPKDKGCGGTARWAGLLVAALAVAVPSNLYSQDEPQVIPGDRVRVLAPSVSPDRLVGTMLAMDPDSCVLDVEGRYKPVAVPLASLTSLQVSRGKRSLAGPGAVVGMLTGGIAGVSLALSACKVEGACRSNGEDKTVVVALVLGVGGAALGAGVGALLGAFKKVDRWEEVPLDAIRVGPAPNAPGGVAISVSLRL